MFPLPDPLHPAIVHFPIVLLALGAAVAVVAVVLNRWHLPWIAAALLGMGAIGAFFAAETGEDAEDSTGSLTAPAETLLEEHEEAAERTEAAGAAAAVIAIAAAALGTFRARRNAVVPGSITPVVRSIAKSKLTLILRAVTALVALTSCWFIYQTGHAGGKLVYEHGVGVKQTGAVKR